MNKPYTRLIRDRLDSDGKVTREGHWVGCHDADCRGCEPPPENRFL